MDGGADPPPIASKVRIPRLSKTSKEDISLVKRRGRRRQAPRLLICQASASESRCNQRVGGDFKGRCGHVAALQASPRLPAGSLIR